MKRAGFSLLEMMIAITILTTVMGILYMLTLSMSRATGSEEAKMTSQDSARNAMMFVVRELRQAGAQSIDSSTLPNSTIRYRVATDMDGNGTAVDSSGRLELSGVRTIQVDSQDLNGDGFTTNQLIWTDGARIRVLASNLIPPDPAGVAPPGFQVSSWNRGFRVVVGTQQTSGPQGHLIQSTLSEVIVPRN